MTAPEYVTDAEALAEALPDLLHAADDLPDGSDYRDVFRTIAAALLASDWMRQHDDAVRAEALEQAWDEAADLADSVIVSWSGVAGLHPTEPEPHPAAIAAAGARRTLVVLRSRVSEAFADHAARLRLGGTR